MRVRLVAIVMIVWAGSLFAGEQPGPGRTLGLNRSPADIPGPACEDGLILDDDSVERGYGWVPSAVWGEYVQTFPAGSVSSSKVDSVCVCWTRTRADDALNFEVVGYADRQGEPGLIELFAVPGQMTDVPEWPEVAFVEVPFPADAPVLSGGAHHIGVRWNPAADQFFFVCADQSPTDHPAGGFFRDDRADGEWGDIFETTDPIFDDHAAMMVRPRTVAAQWVPTLGRFGVIVLAGILGLMGCILLRRR